MFAVRSRSKVFVPKGVDNAHNSETGSDDHKALISHGRSLRRDVLVLAPFQHSLMNTVQADTVRIGFTRNLIKFCGQMFHTTHFTTQFLNVTDFTDSTNAKVWKT